MPFIPIAQRPPDEQQFWRLPAPYKLTGPAPDLTHADVIVVAGMARKVKYNIDLQPGLAMILDSSTYGRPRWMVMFEEDKSGKHRFAEAGSEKIIVTDLWDFVEHILVNCKIQNYKPQKSTPFRPVTHSQALGMTPRAPE